MTFWQFVGEHWFLSFLALCFTYGAVLALFDMLKAFARHRDGGING